MANISKVNSIITDYFIEQIEENKQLPWCRPWSKFKDKPQNFKTGIEYRGINSLLLTFGKTPYWLTFNQIKELGGKLKKGSRSAPCVFFTFAEDKEKTNKDGTPATYAMLKYYRVFNLADCEGIENNKETGVMLRENNTITECENIVKGYSNAPKIEADGLSNSAFYSSADDKVVMPHINQFNSAEGYYQVLFHELGHSTGHKSRLNRKMGNLFGSHAYSKEELIAELTASFLSRESGLDGNIDNSAAYLQSWLSTLRENPTWLINSAQQAQKGFDLILGYSE